MADVKWIKITTDMFDNRKIKHLRRLPDGNNIVLIWVMLLTMAGRCNANGMVFLTENIPYTPKMLADELDFEENTVILALQALENLNMIVTNSGFFTISGWQEYQNIDGMEKIREQNRIRQANFKQRQKLIQGNVIDNVTVTEGNATEEDIDKEKEEDIEREKIDYKGVVALYHSICISFPSVKKITERRKAAIRARLNTYTMDDFRTVFEKAEASSFLKGGNDRNWTADFDWLINDANMAKVLEDKYADKQQRRYGGRKEPVPGWCKSELGDAELEAIKNVLQDSTTIGNSQELADRAEKLKERLQGGGV